MESRERRTNNACRGGINRVVAILLALIAVMLVIIAIPGWQRYQERAEVLACEQAMKSARDGLIIDYLSNWQEGSVQDAMQTLDDVMPARANICPAGGTVYLLRNDKGIFEPYCGLHTSDKRLRARLNASRAKELLEEGLREARKSGEEPETVEIQLNGKPLAIERVSESVPIYRGTATTNGYDGVVAFFGIAGEGSFEAGSKAHKGEIAYFLYADELYCAVWRADDGWTGDAYDGAATRGLGG